MTGFYVAAITLGAAIGYEKGKNYSLRVAATVNGILGADVHTFQIEAEVDANAVSVTVNANVSSITAGSISANAFTAGALQGLTLGTLLGAVTVNATAASAIAVKVWDEPKSSHTTADTYGEYLDATVSGISGGAGDTTVSPTAVAAIADAVWSEPSSGYTTAGSMGYLLNDSQSVGAIRDAVWNATKASYSVAGTFGEFLDATISGIAGGSADTTVSPTAIAAIADAVWDETGSDHTSAGSFGARLNVSINSMTANAIGPVTVNGTAASAIAALVTGASIGPVTVGATAASAIASLVTANSIGGVTVNATAAAAIAALVDKTVNATAAAAIASAVWEEPKASHTTADTYGEYLDSTTNAIKGVVDAIKLKTDLIFAGTANSLAVDIKYVNGVSVTGNGQSGTEWGPGS
jgi:hypothetical protein